MSVLLFPGSIPELNGLSEKEKSQAIQTCRKSTRRTIEFWLESAIHMLIGCFILEVGAKLVEAHVENVASHYELLIGFNGGWAMVSVAFVAYLIFAVHRSHSTLRPYLKEYIKRLSSQGIRALSQEGSPQAKTKSRVIWMFLLGTPLLLELVLAYLILISANETAFTLKSPHDGQSLRQYFLCAFAFVALPSILSLALIVLFPKKGFWNVFGSASFTLLTLVFVPFYANLSTFVPDLYVNENLSYYFCSVMRTEKKCVQYNDRVNMKRAVLKKLGVKNMKLM